MGIGGAGWGGGPGWAVASASPESTSTEGTALAKTPASTITEFTGFAGIISPTADANARDSNSGSTSFGAQVAAPVIGGIAGVGIIALILYWCCQRKPRSEFKLKFKRKTVGSKENQKRLREAEEIAADRERALRDLENRRRERETQPQSFMGFDFGALGQDHGHANGVEPVPKRSMASRSPRWI